MMSALSDIRKARWSDDDWSFVQTESDRKAVLDGCLFDRKAADRVCHFMAHYLCLTTGEWAGKPFVPLAWQRERILYPLFGWKLPNGLRRFRQAYIQVAKKNGKSELMSGLSLYLAFGDREARSLVVCAACDRAQAGIVWESAALMVEKSPELRASLEVLRSNKSILRRSDMSCVRPISSDAGGSEGHNAHAVLRDELHAWKGRQLWDSLLYSGTARKQPIQITITTAGYDRQSICYEEYERAKAVLSGTFVDTRLLPVVFEPDEGDDWSAPGTWRKANPSIGEIIREEELAAEQASAARTTAAENTFRRYHLNQWTSQESRWIPIDAWDACARSLDIEDFTGCPCVLGMDIGDRNATTALVACFPPCAVCDVPVLFAWFFLPEEDIEGREIRDHANYRDWHKAGILMLTPGARFTRAPIRDKIVELSSRFEVTEIAYDPVMANELATELDRDYGLKMVEHRQGFVSMTEPAKNFEASVVDRGLAHDGNSMLRSHVENVTVVSDSSGNIKPVKGQATRRVDGVIAAVMAFGRAMVHAGTGYVDGEVVTLEW